MRLIASSTGLVLVGNKKNNTENNKEIASLEQEAQCNGDEDISCGLLVTSRSQVISARVF